MYADDSIRPADDSVRPTDDSAPVYVRALGYVDDEPVVRRIGDRDLFIGNVHAADPSKQERRFEHVLSATSDEQPLTTHHHPLHDGPDNAFRAFEAAVDATREFLRADGSLLVHCKAGISRSSALIAAALAAETDRRFLDALADVQQARPHAVPNPALHELAVIYLASKDGPGTV